MKRLVYSGLLAGCSIFGSLDGISDGPPQGAVDGGQAAPVSDASGPVIQEGGSPETGVPADTGTPEVPQPCPVVGHPVALCAMFDEGSPEKGFVTKTENGGGRLSIDGKALLVTLPGSAIDTAAYLKGTVSRPERRITMTTSLMPIDAVATTAFQVEFGPDEIKIRLGSPPQFRETIVGATSDVVVSSADLPALADRAWARVTLAVDLTATASTVSVKYGDTVVLADHPVRAHLYKDPVEVKVGSITTVSTGAAGFQLRFDDVVVERD
jgi:hypothetical protein